MAGKKKSKFIPVIAGLIAIIVIFGIVFAMNFSSLAKQLTQKVASNTLGVSVNIDDLNVDFKNRKITLENVTVGNPRGYTEFRHALELESINIDADILSKELLTFDDISVGKTDIFFEVDSRASNLGIIKGNLDENTPRNETEAKTEQAIRVIIRKLNFANTTLYTNLKYGNKKNAALSLPPISMRGIGEKGDGLLAGQAVAQVMDEIIYVASRTAAKEGLFSEISPSQLKNLTATNTIMDQLGKETGKIRYKLKDLTGQ